MIILLEAAWLGILLFVVWILFRAARARPDEVGIQWAARGALVAWIVFAARTLIDFEYIANHPWQVATWVLIAAAIAGVVLGYRALLIAARKQADRR